MRGPNAKLLQGLQELGVHGEELPRNCLSKKCSAYCNFGCRSGHKQSSDVTWLVDAVRMGAHVLTGVEAQRVLLEANDKADAVRADMLDAACGLCTCLLVWCVLQSLYC
jgi:long-chain-alcohol oxidase